MYVNPVWLGVGITLLVELIVLVVLAVTIGRKDGK